MWTEEEIATFVEDSGTWPGITGTEEWKIKLGRVEDWNIGQEKD